MEHEACRAGVGSREEKATGLSPNSSVNSLSFTIALSASKRSRPFNPVWLGRED